MEVGGDTHMGDFLFRLLLQSTGAGEEENGFFWSFLSLKMRVIIMSDDIFLYNHLDPYRSAPKEEEECYIYTFLLKESEEKGVFQFFNRILLLKTDLIAMHFFPLEE